MGSGEISNVCASDVHQCINPFVNEYIRILHKIWWVEAHKPPPKCLHPCIQEIQPKEYVYHYCLTLAAAMAAMAESFLHPSISGFL